jgi:hypothetical protein
LRERQKLPHHTFSFDGDVMPRLVRFSSSFLMNSKSSSGKGNALPSLAAVRLTKNAQVCLRAKDMGRMCYSDFNPSQYCML